MSWTPLATQFCLELAFGLLFALAFVPKAPVGTLFYRVMGTTAVVPLALGILVPSVAAGGSWWSTTNLCAALGVLAFPVYSGPVRGKAWGAGLALALAGTAAAVFGTLRDQAPELGVGGLLLAWASALVTGVVAGSVGLAMVLGHWYLTVPNLAVKHLRRVNRMSVTSMVASLLLVGISCYTFQELLNAADRPLFGATGLFYLGTRLCVGLLFPLVFAGLAASSLRFDNTRSATGILYASTVLVLIGTAVSVSLQDSYGVPL